MKNHCINKTYSVQDDLTEPVVKHEKVDFFIVLINLDIGFDRRKLFFFLDVKKVVSTKEPKEEFQTRRHRILEI
jgi:aromatic ring-opening dioxygenase LigB subunit